MEQQLIRPEGFFIILRFFRSMQFAPYIAIGLLVLAIALWIVFGKKKFRWAKIIAIILTVLLIIAAIISLIPFIFTRNLSPGFQGDRQPPAEREKFNQRQNSSPESVGLNYIVSAAL